jgi:drug/metabolite transporter (DMT)-like permease
VISAGLLHLFISLTGLRQKILRSDFKLILLSSLFNPFLYFLCENYGLKFSTPTLAAVIIATIPVFSPIVAWFTFRERLTRLNLVGIAISFSGILIMLMNRDLQIVSDPRGLLFLFGAVFSALFYSVVLKRLTSRYSALTLVSSQNLIGIFLFLPFFLLMEADQALTVPITGSIVTSFLLLAVLASSAAFVFFAHSVKLIGISKSNIFSNLIPVFTAFFSFLLIQEEFTLRKIAGIAVVITGVYLSERSKKNGA